MTFRASPRWVLTLAEEVLKGVTLLLFDAVNHYVAIRR